MTAPDSGDRGRDVPELSAETRWAAGTLAARASTTYVSKPLAEMRPARP